VGKWKTTAALKSCRDLRPRVISSVFIDNNNNNNNNNVEVILQSALKEKETTTTKTPQEEGMNAAIFLI
jgi:hypothetical protein